MIKSYEGVLGIIKKYWNESLRLYYVPAEYDPIILNVIGDLLSMKQFKFVRSLEILLEPIELNQTGRGFVVVMSTPMLNHYFNQPLTLQDNPVKFIRNSNPLKSINAMTIEKTKKHAYSKQVERSFHQYASPRQRQISIQMMRIALLAIHVQQHYLRKTDQDTPDHRGFHTLEMAVRVKKTTSFYDNGESEDESTDGNEDYYDD